MNFELKLLRVNNLRISSVTHTARSKDYGAASKKINTVRPDYPHGDKYSFLKTGNGDDIKNT